MRQRQALFRHLRAFIAAHMRGLFGEVDFKFDPGLPEEGGLRRSQTVSFAKHREIVTVRFPADERYAITVKSPNEVPPLGEVELFINLNLAYSGQMQPQTWEDVARVILEDHNPPMEDQNGTGSNSKTASAG